MSRTIGAVAAAALAAAAAARAEERAEPAPQAGAPAVAPQAPAEARESLITAKRIEFDNKEGVILFDENVFVDDAQFLLRADRLLVFMEGTNDVQQLMAVGRVSLTNENRAASCDKAVYTKKDGQIVMTGRARLVQQGKDAGEVTGDKITIWLDDQRMVVEPGTVRLPSGTFNKSDLKLLP